LTPSNIYAVLDENVRESILYMANDVGLGVGLGIIAVAFVFKIIFSPAMILAVFSLYYSKLFESIHIYLF